MFFRLHLSKNLPVPLRSQEGGHENSTPSLNTKARFLRYSFIELVIAINSMNFNLVTKREGVSES